MCPFTDHCLLCCNHHPQNYSSQALEGSSGPLLRNTLLSIVNVKIEVIQLFKSTAYSILVRHVEIFSCLCIFVHWSLVTGVVECYRIYHVLSNLLGMLRNSFVVLSSKQYFLDFFEDVHVPMPDISGYIRERVKDPQYTHIHMQTTTDEIDVRTIFRTKHTYWVSGTMR